MRTLEKVMQPTEAFTASAVYAAVQPLAHELSVMTPNPETNLREELYGTLGVRRTPLNEAGQYTRNRATPGADLLFVKGEHMQPVASFKIRGASVGVALAAYDAFEAGTRLEWVETASAGNHAQGVAHAAGAVGISEVITHTFNGISQPKETALKRQKVTVVKHPTLERSVKVAQEADHRPGSAYIPPYDSYDVMAGQSTVASEIVADLLPLAEAGHLDLLRDEIHIFAAGGGGGLSSGMAVELLNLKYAGVLGKDNVKLWVVQGENSNAIELAREGKQLERANPWYDGSRVTQPGKRNMAILKSDRAIAGAFEVSERITGEAMEILRILHHRDIESTGALSMAGAMQLATKLPPVEEGRKRIFVTITSGANVSHETVAHFRHAAGLDVVPPSHIGFDYAKHIRMQSVSRPEPPEVRKGLWG